MNSKPQAAIAKKQAGNGLFLGLAVMLTFFLVSGYLSFVNTQTLRRNATLVTQTHEVLIALGDILSYCKDAETGQRGFVLTGNDDYLEPYTTAKTRIQERLGDIERIAEKNPRQLELLPTLRKRIDNKLAELAETITLRRDQGFDAAREVVVSNRGKRAMDDIRTQIEAMQSEERTLRNERLQEMDNAHGVAIGSGILTAVSGIGLSLAVTYLMRRAFNIRQKQEWLHDGQIKISQVMAGDLKMTALGENILSFLADYLGAKVGALFVHDGTYQRVATIGVPADSSMPKSFAQNDGLLWQAAREQRVIILNDVPAGYLSLGSGLGSGIPRHLLIVPITEDGETNGVIELGFLQPVSPAMLEIFERISEPMGVAVRSVKYRNHLQNLLEETQRQSEELQTQSEELRVSNEELEEQSRALRESQARLENQQSELEQTNTQLEEQAIALETQRDEISLAKNSLELQAQRLAQASQYKSDFLANMSHELRTPLNSSLILAKLLADNPTGSLSDEQVQYAQTIQNAGNDLLALINDILDLSKIEAGHMEIRPDEIKLTQLTNDLERTFRPMAEHKGLRYSSKIFPGTPELFESDRQRFEQILKNLLSNAIKFTERGQVELEVRRDSDHSLTFSVTDTGIGIPLDKQGIVFEAFQQVESTTHRRFGGTGLGLSISRELSRLLGGHLHLASEPGKGSTFSVTIPLKYDATLIQPRSETPTALVNQPAPELLAKLDLHKPGVTPKITRHVADDREKLTGTRRIILVVEDDHAFAKILYELTHDLNFQCLIATSAEEGLALAIQYLPSAVILDIGLPDNSGLMVLDRLKHDRRTRHIPVHVISGGDYAQTAMELGAVGYLLKPVPRDELENALVQLETRLAQRMRRVLVVEDDAVQLDSLRKLLNSHDVETVGASNAAECLEQLRNNTYDCMVLDLSLPDASGFSLLETLTNEEDYAFPPVIVYTGRVLSTDEEQRLRRYSKSIIIKGAKSPERLLDEVTLFLHQVVSDMPAEQQRMLELARSRDAAIEGKRILIVEDDVRNVFALTSILEPHGAVVQIARNGLEALELLNQSQASEQTVDLILMDVMMPEMDGITAVREIRKESAWKKIPIIMLTAKAMRDDQETCLAAGANDYMSKPLDVEKLLSLIRVWIPR